MKIKPIIIVTGEPKSIFYEIFFKSLKKNKFKSPLLLVTSVKLFKKQMKKFKFKGNIKLVDTKNLGTLKNKNNINIINVNYNKLNQSKKDYIVSNIYIKECFDIAFKLLK